MISIVLTGAVINISWSRMTVLWDDFFIYLEQKFQKNMYIVTMCLSNTRSVCLEFINERRKENRIIIWLIILDSCSCSGYIEIPKIGHQTIDFVTCSKSIFLSIYFGLQLTKWNSKNYYVFNIIASNMYLNMK